MSTKTITPVYVYDLITYKAVSLLSVLNEDAVPPAQRTRDNLALYVIAHQLEEKTACHLSWVDDEIQRVRQTAVGQELVLLIGDEQPVRTAELPMQIRAVRELLHTVAQLEFVESHTALLELARTVTDPCGMEDALTANGDGVVHKMEQVWELLRGAVSAEYAERRQTLLGEADIRMDELRGCLDLEAEVGDGKQLLAWEKLRSELEGVAGAPEASEQGAVPRWSHTHGSRSGGSGLSHPCGEQEYQCRALCTTPCTALTDGVIPCYTCEGRTSVETVYRECPQRLEA